MPQNIVIFAENSVNKKHKKIVAIFRIIQWIYIFKLFIFALYFVLHHVLALSHVALSTDNSTNISTMAISTITTTQPYRVGPYFLFLPPFAQKLLMPNW